MACFDDASNHERHVAAFCEELKVFRQWNMGKDYVLEDVDRLADAVLSATCLCRSLILHAFKLASDIF